MRFPGWLGVITRALSILIVVGFGIAIFLALPLLRTPEFKVENATNEEVQVVAHWRETSKSLGLLGPDSQVSFKVGDEAAMSFTVTHTDGRQEITTPIYFTSGTTVQAVITPDGINVEYEWAE